LTAQSPLEAARAYLAADISIIPIACDGTKKPACRWKQYEDHLANPGELLRWFGGTKPCAMAAVCGVVSGGLELLDLDDERAGQEWTALMEENAPDLLACLTIVRTPRPGLHVWYRVAGMAVPGNQKLSHHLVADAAGQMKQKALAETRGEGGYAILPGSPAEAHETGRLYTHVGGPGFNSLSIINAEERALVLDFARLLDRMPASKIRLADTPRGHDRPGGDYEERGESWAELLERHGWRRLGSRQDYELWQRPGKDGNGHSATLGYCRDAQGRPRLRVFSSSSEFRTDESYSKFGAYAALEHGGDFAAAASALGRLGFGQPARPSAKKQDKATASVAQQQPEDDFENAELKAPRPILAEEAYAGVLGQIVRLIEPQTEADPAGILVQLLAAVGNCIGRMPHIRIEGDCHRGNLFACCVGDTAAARKGTSWGRVRQVMELAWPEWAQKNIKGGLHSGEGLIYHVRDRRVQIKDNGGQAEEVVLDEGSDIREVLILESEFASVLSRMGRQGNTLSAVVRQAWDGATLSSLTKHSPDRASSAHVSIVGHITEEELKATMASCEAWNGFVNRFLWACVRRSKVLPFGGGEIDLAGPCQDLTMAIGWAKWRGPVSWSESSRRLWVDLYPTLTAGRPGILGAVTARGASQVLRLALIYSLLDRSDLIEENHLHSAMAVWDFCQRSAERIFGSSESEESLAERTLADDLYEKLIKAGEAGLTRKQIRDSYGRNKQSSELVRVLESLRDRGLAYSLKRSTTGRPVEVWFRAPHPTTETTETTKDQTDCLSEAENQGTVFCNTFEDKDLGQSQFCATSTDQVENQITTKVRPKGTPVTTKGSDVLSEASEYTEL
jgi:hypothetical protein